jgi:hypothetical protein
VEINRERGITVLLVEQNANLALEVSTYGYVLETGRVILAPVAVQQKARSRPRPRLQAFLQSTPGLQTMNARRDAILGGDGQLFGEHLTLFLDRRRHQGRQLGGNRRPRRCRAVQNPAVHSNLAHRCLRMSFELTPQTIAPMRRSFAQVPRMQSEGGHHEAPMSLGQARDRFPIRLAGSVDDHAHNPGLATGRHQLVLPPRESIVVQMIVSVEQAHASSSPYVARWRIAISPDATQPEAPPGPNEARRGADPLRW